MTADQKTIYVYDHFSGEEPALLGELYCDRFRGEESFSFAYHDEWLQKKKPAFGLDPELPLFSGRQFPSDKALFGMFADACPDRWGRVLMDKRERIRSDREGRRPRKLFTSDYLLGVYDEARMGGLRFKEEIEGGFLSDDKETTVPPWARLRSLEEAARNYEKDDFGVLEKWLERLIRPGSSLGGARPKATVVDMEGSLWIAKFPSKHDENDSGAWEMVAHDLARCCGLRVPEAKLEVFSKYGSTYLTRRFDREKKKRIHYASAMTLLGKRDGEAAAEGVSYLDIASFIKANGANPKADLLELWKRIVFSMAITNTDDHLRNHAFLLEENGWRLSPLFDVNPVPYGDELALRVDGEDNRIDKELVLASSIYFGIERSEAKHYAGEIICTVQDNWKRLATEYGISRGKIEAMRPAFRWN